MIRRPLTAIRYILILLPLMTDSHCWWYSLIQSSMMTLEHWRRWPHSDTGQSISSHDIPRYILPFSLITILLFVRPYLSDGELLILMEYWWSRCDTVAWVGMNSCSISTLLPFDVLDASHFPSRRWFSLTVDWPRSFYHSGHFKFLVDITFSTFIHSVTADAIHYLITILSLVMLVHLHSGIIVLSLSLRVQLRYHSPDSDSSTISFGCIRLTMSLMMMTRWWLPYHLLEAF